MTSPLSAAYLPTVSRESSRGHLLDRFGTWALPRVVTAWCLVAVLGQLVFAAYVAARYGGALAAGHPEAWNKTFHGGWVAGRPLGNAVTAAHLAGALVVLVAGALQVLPAIRRRWPAVHRASGRAYLVAALVSTAAGLVMITTRDVGGGLVQRLGISGDFMLVLAFSALAFRAARARRLDEHRRWALRLFVVAPAVWFFRIFLMAWVVLNHGPVGFDPKSFEGPFLSVLSFAQYLLPLAVAEGYLRVRAGGAAPARVGMAGVLVVAIAITALGTGAAAMALWLPRMH